MEFAAVSKPGLAFKPVGRILSRPCNDWPRGSLNESIFTAIGEDFCHGLRMSFWDFGFHTVGDLVFKTNPGLMYNAGLRIRFVWPIYRPSSHKGLNLRVASVFSCALASYMFFHAGFIGSQLQYLQTK